MQSNGDWATVIGGEARVIGAFLADPRIRFEGVTEDQLAFQFVPVRASPTNARAYSSVG